MTEATEIAVAPAGSGTRITRGFWAERNPRWVRGYVGGHVVVDSKNSLLVYERTPFPVWWFPEADVKREYLSQQSGHDGRTAFWDLRVADRTIERAARSLPSPTGEESVLNGYIAFYWDKIDTWFEEDDQVFTHARDPYTRIDVIHSSRHIRAEIDGVEFVNSHRPSLLFETGLPTRYYIPKQDFQLDLLHESDTRTHCPYKGAASYYSVQAGDKLIDDIVWYYPTPFSDCAKIENLLSIYNEKVDIYLDGELQERPKSRRS